MPLRRSNLAAPLIFAAFNLAQVRSFALGVGMAAGKLPKGLSVTGSSVQDVNGDYEIRAPEIIPAGFTATCVQMNWPHMAMWKKLSDGKRPWFESGNGSYIYWNRGDGCWWIDGPSGAGVYIQENPSQLPPEDGKWKPLNAEASAAQPKLRLKGDPAEL